MARQSDFGWAESVSWQMPPVANLLPVSTVERYNGWTGFPACNVIVFVVVLNSGPPFVLTVAVAVTVRYHNADIAVSD
jgi:hypothetical protein